MLAYKNNTKKLQNSIIDKFYDTCRTADTRDAYPPPFSMILYVYKNTSGLSSFRKLIIGWLVWHFGNDVECAAELVVGLSQRVAGSRHSPFDTDRAVFYEDYDSGVKGEDPDNKGRSMI